MSKIALLDPSLPEAAGLEADNLGDCIIYDAIKGVLADLFPTEEIVRFPTKRSLTRDEVDLIKQCRLIFLGGTNLLSGNLAAYNQWKINSSIISMLRPPAVSGVVALGVGWWQYQEHTTLRTRLFYRRVLHSDLIHSVRDEYTRSKLSALGVAKVVNTSCPTLWSLDGQSTRRIGQESIAFALTDYNQVPEVDNALIALLLEHSSRPLIFFPLGRGDIEYITSLSGYRANRSRITLMKRSLDELAAVASDERVSYVGTRLHCGIRFLQSGRGALILAVDNRASEIHRDTGLPAVPRRDIDSIRAWLCGERDFGPIRVPVKDIADWKAQFASL